MRLLTFLLTVLLSVTVNSGQVHVTHFWASPGEQNAVNVFAEAYKNQGGEWIHNTQDSYPVLKGHVLPLIADGYPPSAMQWVVSPTLFDLIASGVLTTFDKSSQPKALSQLYPYLLELVTYNSEIGAIPVSVHGENWAYYNAKIMKKMNLNPAKNWDDFFQQMQKIEAAGYSSIAMGSHYWEIFTAFKSMLVAAGGIPLIIAVREGKLPEQMADKLTTAFDYLIRFRDLFLRSGFKTASWHEATSAIIKGQAVVQIMGDWVKGEMTYLGAKPGEDFLCAMAPGNQDVYLLAIDTFVFPILESTSAKVAQKKLIDIILEPINQVEFSRRKGSIPVRFDIEKSKLDMCGQIGVSIFTQKGAAEPSFVQGTNPIYADILQSIIQQIWSHKISSAKQAQIEMTKLMQTASNI